MPTTLPLSTLCVAIAAALLALPAAAQPAGPAASASSLGGPGAERRSTLDDQQSVAVTIYNEDLALVKETRRVVLEPGRNRIALRDVSARMRPETAQLRSLSNPGGFDLLEQNFDFDLLTPAKLLEKYTGRTVRVIRTHPTTGAETVESAKVLSTAEGAVLQIGDRIEIGAPGRIVFDGVWFAYEDERWVLADCRFTIAPGERVALVGTTGEGKSTCVRLLTRTWDVSRGRVLVDGVDVRELELGSLRRSVGVIFQETFLVSAYVLENIAYGKPRASRAEVE